MNRIGWLVIGRRPGVDWGGAFCLTRVIPFPLMPQALRQACRTPGCPNAAVKHGRCAACAAQQERLRTAERGSPSARGYGHRWQALRLLVLRAQPACVVCGAEATDVDHIVPKSRGGADAVDNLQPLCHACHTKKTNKERQQT